MTAPTCSICRSPTPATHSLRESLYCLKHATRHLLLDGVIRGRRLSQLSLKHTLGLCRVRRARAKKPSVWTSRASKPKLPRVPRVVDPPGQRLCTKCGATKAIEDFPLQTTRGRTSRRRQCQVCMKKNYQRWNQERA